MSDRVLIPFGPEILVLSAEEFEQARERGRSLTVARAPASSVLEPSTALESAAEIAAHLSLPKSCIYEYAKAGRIPCTRVGRHVRFNRQAVLAALSPGAVTVGRA